MKVKRSLKCINQNIETTEELISSYADKKRKLKLKPVKHSYSCICGTLGCMFGMSMVSIPKMDMLILSGLGGFLAGYVLPYAAKKIRIGELDYNIYVNNLIIKDLNKEKERVQEEKKKTLHI